MQVVQTETMLRETGFGFLFAPLLHGAMRHAAGPRREIGVRTIFNLLGPLTNPAGARHHLLGVFDGRWVEPLAHVLGRLGSVHALVVHGDDGLDELTTTTASDVAELRDGKVRRFRIEPDALGLKRARLSDLQVDTAEQSAQMIRTVLAGESGPARDLVLLNAGAAIYAADLASTIEAGVASARTAIDTGRARDTLERVVRASHAGGRP
jgi:anthranilate phosphoribosyltransferase